MHVYLLIVTLFQLFCVRNIEGCELLLTPSPIFLQKDILTNILYYRIRLPSIAAIDNALKTVATQEDSVYAVVDWISIAHAHIHSRYTDIIPYAFVAKLWHEIIKNMYNSFLETYNVVLFNHYISSTVLCSYVMERNISTLDPTKDEVYHSWLDQINACSSHTEIIEFFNALAYEIDRYPYCIYGWHLNKKTKVTFVHFLLLPKSNTYAYLKKRKSYGINTRTIYLLSPDNPASTEYTNRNYNGNFTLRDFFDLLASLLHFIKEDCSDTPALATHYAYTLYQKLHRLESYFTTQHPTGLPPLIAATIEDADNTCFHIKTGVVNHLHAGKITEIIQIDHRVPMVPLCFFFHLMKRSFIID